MRVSLVSSAPGNEAKWALHALAENIKLRHNTPSGTRRRKSKDCHLSVFVQNCHTSAENPFKAERIHEEWAEPLISYVPRIRIKGQPTADNGIMTQQKTNCLAAVLVSFCITFMPGGTTGCTGEPTCMFCLNYWVVGILSK